MLIALAEREDGSRGGARDDYGVLGMGYSAGDRQNPPQHAAHFRAQD